MNIAIISTYPRAGSQNTGDKLIEQATIDVVKQVHPTASISTFWRAASWEEVENIADFDHVIFACLAIRSKLDSVYPYLDRIIDLGVPFSVVAAGTDLNPAAHKALHDGFSKSDLALLQRVSSAAKVFTTRGALTQYFCRQVGIDGAEFSGDIAFFDPRFDDRVFKPGAEVKRIAISDPHYSMAYAEPLNRLVSGLRLMFPTAGLVMNVHGRNPFAEYLAKTNGLPVERLYERPADGLDAYDDIDLHLGFRVHAHVSALKRRKYSYLLEQDGRGRDYGLTISRRLSVPCEKPKLHLLRRAIGKVVPHEVLEKMYRRNQAPASAVDSILAKVQLDFESDFIDFSGLESEIISFGLNNVRALRRALNHMESGSAR